MKRLFLVPLMIVLVGALIFGGCAKPAPAPAPTPTPAPAPAPAPTPAPQKVFELRFGKIGPPLEVGVSGRIYLRWFDWLERESGGRIKVTYVPEVGGPGDVYDAARTGVIDIAHDLADGLVGRIPLQEVTQLPFMFKSPSSWTQSNVLMQLYEKYPEIQAELKDTKVLGLTSSDVPHFHMVSKQIKTIEDLKGQVVIAIGRWATEAMEKSGGTPHGSMIGQDYDMLSKGMVDGIWVNYEATYTSFLFHEVTHYTTESSGACAGFVRVMNLDTFNSLPPDLQELFIGENARTLDQLFGYTFDYAIKWCREGVNKYRIEHGDPEIYVLPDAEVARFKEATKPVWDIWVKEAAAIVGEAKAEAILEDCQALAEKYPYKATPVAELEKILKAWDPEDTILGPMRP